MTACVNRKHTKKVAAVVTASLVGALSLGVAPVAAMAEDTGIDLQFIDPTGAFENGEVTATLKYGAKTTTFDSRTEDAASFVFVKNAPAALDTVTVHMFAGATATGDLTINANDKTDDFEVAYYKRGEDGYPTGDAITSDISAVGNYVAVVTAVDGQYEGSKVYVPFDILPIQVTNVDISSECDNPVTYNAENHEYKFTFDGVPVYEGIDYTVEYIYTGHDATAENVTDVNEAGTYRAKITGIGNYAGTVELSEVIKVNKLDLNASNVKIIGLTSSASDAEPKNLFAIVIDGKVYSGDDAIMNELKAELLDTTKVWFDNGLYKYVVTAKNPSEGNIEDSNYFDANKVSNELTFTYNGAAWADSYEVVASDSSTYWSSSKVKGTASNGTIGGVTVSGTSMNVTVYDENGSEVNIDYMNTNPGTYTVVYDYVASDNSVGGVAFTTVTTYENRVNADATAAVLYDVDGDGKKDIVTSINDVYDGSVISDDIVVYVEDEGGNDVTASCDVKYYDANGNEIGSITNAGTYTLKVTSKDYKISGTTEMTITVSPLDISNLTVGALKTAKFDDVHAGVVYLPWEKDGVTIDGLALQYEDVNEALVALPMDIVKVTILDSEGNEVKKITDEGVYTIHFEARNEDAANNYTIPADITVTCIKDGSQADGISHLVFTDVSYSDYFADPVYYVNAKKFMNGYADTNIFGSYDQLTRGQVACVLYNMAMDNRKVDEDSLHYVEGQGYVTGFSDVNGEMYYAKAIAWAKQAGVVNGYGDGTFAPDAPVTREEFAAMLANYAKLYDADYKDADVSVLDEFDDANGVSDWAEEVVAWAVENGIMGNGGFLNAQGDIIRADAACMVYNYAIAE